MIYLDSAAFSHSLPCALEAYYNAPFGNPSSEHAVGQVARNALEDARKRIARCIDCEASEVYFVSTATEAAALVAHSLEESRIRTLFSKVEHHAISENFPKYYYPARGWTKTPRVVKAIMLANNEVGAISSEKNVAIRDATAAVGHIPISFRELGCSYLIADGVKFGGVPGAAFLVAKDGAPLSPLIRGGGQERGMRSGTENVPAICAMAAALEWQMGHMMENTEHINSLFSLMYDLLNQIPDHQWNTPLHLPVLPHILNISFKGVNGKALALLLSKNGVMVSAGAACSNGLNEPSHVLMAMFDDEDRARSAIRISFSRENTEAEVEEAAEKIKDAVEFLRSVS